ncbi:Aste57867_24205 [Aphanomyces stellatus]|uniref:Aste57867_24205 protein n=1 Tax=Aphanomyces stellatus TaxID=120398 RepID=A0A485LQ14_9STRA|nr:hypothetical protein As57867_024131 [Aphanomyces stellatus]VFU00847.1 Aste57867_24205 [Aphanomyces stellatus]
MYEIGEELVATDITQDVIFVNFVLTTDVLTMPNDPQCIVRVTQISNSSRKWVAKLTNKKNELDFIQYVYAENSHVKMKEHIVNCETWGLVELNDFQCHAVIMEEGKEDCKHRIHHIKSLVFNIFGCLSDIFNSIQACHDIGCIHDDVKHENIVFLCESESTDSSMGGTVHDLAKILEYQAKAELLHLVKDKPADDVDIDETGENTHLKETECDVAGNGKKENGRGPTLNEMEMTPSTGANAE